MKRLCLLVTTGCILAAGSGSAQDIGALKKSPPVALHGNFSAALNGYTNLFHGKDSATAAYGPSPAYFLQAAPVLSVYGIALPFTFTLASQNKSFGTPFNRFGASPSYKWIKLHLGWRSLNWSQFTLGGQQMFGVGAELTPGKWRFGFLYGRFNNAVTDISVYNNLNDQVPLYKRKGYAAKIGYGSAASFIEFSYLQARDDSNSVPAALRDSAAVRPQANQVAGLNAQLTIARAVTLHVEGAASYYTGNLASDTVSLDNSFTKLAATPPKTSSQLAFAGEASLNYRFRLGTVDLKYRRVDPNFQSMGAFYMQTDLEQYTAGISLNLWKNKVRFQGNIGRQYNNLAGLAADETHRTIGNATLSVNPSQAFGVDFTYSNYGIAQQIIPTYRDPSAIVRYDSVRISQVNQSVSVAPHYLISAGNLQHTFNLQADWQFLQNNNAAMSDQNYTSAMSSLLYSLTLLKEKLSVNVAANYFNTIMTGSKSATLGYNLGVVKSIARTDPGAKTKPFLQGINLSLTAGWFSNSLNGASSGNTLTVNPAVGLVLRGKQSLQLSGSYSHMKSKTQVVPSPRTLVAVRYGVGF